MKQAIFICLILCVIFGVLFLSSGFVLADESTPSGSNDSTPAGPNQSTPPTPEKATLDNPIGQTSISKIIGNIIKTILGLVGVISLVMFIYAGFVWLTAQGKPEAIRRGRDTMVWAVVGLVIVFSSYIILSYVFKILTF